MKKKLLLTVLLCAVLCLAMTAAWASDPIQEGPLTYQLLDDGTLTVNKCDRAYEGALEIPASCQGIPVTQISEYAFCDCTGLTDITFPDSLTAIGESAFEFCSGLTDVTVPDNVTRIGPRAFKSCSSLGHIALPEGLKSIPEGLLRSTPLKSIYLPDSITSIGAEAFSACPLTRIQIPDGVTYIGTEAFWGTQLTSVDLPKSLTTIGWGAFQQCKSLERVSVRSKLEIIDGEAFFGCSALKGIKLPDSVQEINDSAFSDCADGFTVTCHANTYAESWAVRNNYPVSLLPDGPVEYGHNVLSEGVTGTSTCSKEATEAVILAEYEGQPVTAIGPYTFRDCAALTKVTIPGSVTEIGEGAFMNCSALTQITIPKGVKYVHAYAFWGCTGLRDVVFPDGVISFDDAIFFDCPDLQTVTLPSSVIRIGESDPPTSSVFGNAVIICEKGSYAEEWALKNGYKVRYSGEQNVESITLNKTSYTLTRKASKPEPAYTLKATVTPADATDPSVVWTSSDESVATVSKKGKVTALKAGKATITCTAKDGSGVKATCRITVKDTKVSSFKVVQKGKTTNLKGTTVSLKKGKTLTLEIKDLKPTGAVEQGVTFKSSDKKIATVSSKGVIKGLKKGTVTITVQSKDKGYKLTFKVKVK